ncbi:MAG: hypothetical protein V3W36_07210 [Acidimicrobiia bacterium]
MLHGSGAVTPSTGENLGAVVPALVQGGRPAVDARVPAGACLHLRLPAGEVAERWIAAVKSLAESEKKVAIEKLAEVLVAPEVALDERWLRVESETVGVQRLGQLPARRVLSRQLRRRVEALAG